VREYFPKLEVLQESALERNEEYEVVNFQTMYLPIDLISPTLTSSM